MTLNRKLQERVKVKVKASETQAATKVKMILMPPENDRYEEDLEVLKSKLPQGMVEMRMIPKPILPQKAK